MNNVGKVAYPIAETFHSLQGEGIYAGAPMYFVRLAGCSVGKHRTVTAKPVLPLSVVSALEESPLLATGKPAWVCHTYDGRPFYCDTDFNRYSSLSSEEILKECWEGRICLTGGEPLIHDLKPLFLYRDSYWPGISIHLETSGTIDCGALEAWVTVSPKLGCLPSMFHRADEVKLLVDGNFDESKLPPEVLSGACASVFVQPINYEKGLSEHNFKLCYELCKKHPGWRISVQLHKLLGLR